MSKELTVLKGVSSFSKVDILLDLIKNRTNSLYLKDDTLSDLRTHLTLNPNNNYIVFCPTRDDVGELVDHARSKGIDTIRVDSRINDLEIEDDSQPINVYLVKQLLNYYNQRNTLIVSTQKAAMSVDNKYLNHGDRNKWTVVYMDVINESSTQRISFDDVHDCNDYISIDDGGNVSITETGELTSIEWDFRDKILYPLKHEKVKCTHISNGEKQKQTFITYPLIDYYPDNAIVCVNSTARWSYHSEYQDHVNFSVINVGNVDFRKKVDIRFLSEGTLSLYKKEKNADAINSIIEHYHDTLGDDVLYVKNKSDDDYLVFPEQWQDVYGKGVIRNRDYNTLIVLFSCNLTRKEKKEMLSKGLSAARWYDENVIDPIQKFIHKTTILNKDIDETITIILPDRFTALCVKGVLENEYSCDVDMQKDSFDYEFLKGFRSDKVWPDEYKKYRRKINFIWQKYLIGEYADYDIEDKIAKLNETEKWKIADFVEFDLLNSRGNWK